MKGYKIKKIIKTKKQIEICAINIATKERFTLSVNANNTSNQQRRCKKQTTREMNDVRKNVVRILEDAIAVYADKQKSTVEVVLCQYFGHKKSNFFMLHF